MARRSIAERLETICRRLQSLIASVDAPQRARLSTAIRECRLAASETAAETAQTAATQTATGDGDAAYRRRVQALVPALRLTEERERRRFASYLHDEIGQVLAVSRMRLSALHRQLVAPEHLRQVEEVQAYLEQAVRETRWLTFQLSTPVLYDLGIVAAVEWLADTVCGHGGIACAVHDDGRPKPLDNDVQVLIFHAVRELLRNVVDHARATRVDVRLGVTRGMLRVTVSDNGPGTNKGASAADSHSLENGVGLFCIEQSLAQCGGGVEFSRSRGGGFSASLFAPLERRRRRQRPQHEDDRGPVEHGPGVAHRQEARFSEGAANDGR